MPQQSLFASPDSLVGAPDGFRYLAEFLSRAEETALVAEVERLAFHEVRMHGVVARRTVIHFGWDYDYSGWKIERTEPPPPWLSTLRDRCADAAGVEPQILEQFLIARYPPGASIGWHRDAPMFGSPVVGVSLLSPCRMRFRLPPAARRAPASGSREAASRTRQATFEQLLEPRSLYIISGTARSAWQHHIPPTKELRYSITMRTVRSRDLAARAKR